MLRQLDKELGWRIVMDIAWRRPEQKRACLGAAYIIPNHITIDIYTIHKMTIKIYSFNAM